AAIGRGGEALAQAPLGLARVRQAAHELDAPALVEHVLEQLRQPARGDEVVAREPGAVADAELVARPAHAPRQEVAYHPRPAVPAAVAAEARAEQLEEALGVEVLAALVGHLESGDQQRAVGVHELPPWPRQPLDRPRLPGDGDPLLA